MSVHSNNSIENAKVLKDDHNDVSIDSDEDINMLLQHEDRLEMNLEDKLNICLAPLKA